MDLSKIITIGILTFEQEKETMECLLSLKRHLKFKAYILLIDNGSKFYDPRKFLDRGLIDELQINKDNSGCGPATIQMYDSCKTDYLLYLQSDQSLQYDLFPEQILNAIELLKGETFFCIDLAGNQGHGKFSERANIMNVEFYKSIPKPTLGGPGITNDQIYVEQWVQEYFQENEKRIAHIQPTYFKDNGYYSVRGLPDGSIFRHSCWTKEMWLIGDAPTKRFDVYPPLSDNEWENIESLIPQWKSGARGYIPESQRPHSFTNEEIEKMIEGDIKL